MIWFALVVIQVIKKLAFIGKHLGTGNSEDKTVCLYYFTKEEVCQNENISRMVH